MTAPAPQYLFDPKDKPSLPVVQVPLIEADDGLLDARNEAVDGEFGVYLSVPLTP